MPSPVQLSTTVFPATVSVSSPPAQATLACLPYLDEVDVFVALVLHHVVQRAELFQTVICFIALLKWQGGQKKKKKTRGGKDGKSGQRALSCNNGR
jgi:hypothetical protein